MLGNNLSAISAGARRKGSGAHGHPGVARRHLDLRRHPRLIRIQDVRSRRDVARDVAREVRFIASGRYLKVHLPRLLQAILRDRHLWRGARPHLPPRVPCAHRTSGAQGCRQGTWTYTADAPPRGPHFMHACRVCPEGGRGYEGGVAKDRDDARRGAGHTPPRSSPRFA